jgi:hypothetical protein
MEYYNAISPTKKGKLVPINIDSKPLVCHSYVNENEQCNISKQDNFTARSKLNNTQNVLIKEINNNKEVIHTNNDNSGNNIVNDEILKVNKEDNKGEKKGEDKEDNDDKLLENLLLNVKILSNIKEFDKLSTSNDEMLVIDSPSYLQGIYRTLYGDSREETLNKIDNIISDLFKITDEMLDNETKKKKKYHNNFKDDNSTIFQKIAINLSESVKGLQNLKITYIKDVSITSRLDIIINKIQNRINKIVQLLQIVLD